MRLARLAAAATAALLAASAAHAQFLFNPSPVPAKSGTIAAAGAFPASAPYFVPQPGRPYHVQLSGAASLSCVLERQLDGSTWTPYAITSNGTTTLLHNWTYTGAALSEDETETQANVPIRVDCGATLGSYTSGTLNVRISQ